MIRFYYYFDAFGVGGGGGGEVGVISVEYYGVSGTPLALIKSYLTNRYQYVHFDICKSDFLEIRTGIPQ